MAANVMRLTRAGRGLLADAENAGTAAVRLTALALGAGSAAAGAGNDARTALRDERDRAAVTGAAGKQADGRIAVRADCTPTATYSVTEAGLLGRVGGSGAETLVAYWTDGGRALAVAAQGAALTVAGVLDVQAAAADIAVDVSASVTLGAQRLVELADTPSAIRAHGYLRGSADGKRLEWARSVIAESQESDLPANPQDAADNVYLLHNFNGTRYPALALRQGAEWDYVPSLHNMPHAAEHRFGLVERASDAEAAAGADATRYVTPRHLKRHLKRRIAAIPAVPPASETAAGIVERATNAEVAAGADAARYITPAALRSAVGAAILAALDTDSGLKQKIQEKVGGMKIKSIQRGVFNAARASISPVNPAKSTLHLLSSYSSYAHQYAWAKKTDARTGRHPVEKTEIGHKTIVREDTHISLASDGAAVLRHGAARLVHYEVIEYA